MTKFEEKKKEAYEKASMKQFGNADGSRAMRYLLNELENTGLLKEQQALPVVPECVAEVVELLKKNPETLWSKLCGSLGEEGVNWLNEFQHKDERFGIGELNNKLFVLFHLAINGYQVEKQQLFYLKAKELLVVGDYDHVEDLWLDWNKNFTPKKQDAHKFTQQEIGSMQTGSYELVPVEDRE